MVGGRWLSAMRTAERHALISHCTVWVCLTIGPALVTAAAAQADWQAAVRQRVNAQDLTGALDLIQQRLTRAPEDLEALGWRGRVNGWLGR